MTSILRSVVLGAAAGALATAVKGQAEGALQPVAERLLPPSPGVKEGLGADPEGHPAKMPPAELVDRAQRPITGGRLGDDAREQASTGLHWVMGIGSGIAYAVVAERWSGLRAGRGLLGGSLLFAATHGSGLPAAGLQEPPWRLPRAWWIWEGGSHLVYGVALDTALRMAENLAPWGIPGDRS